MLLSTKCYNQVLLSLETSHAVRQCCNLVSDSLEFSMITKLLWKSLSLSTAKIELTLTVESIYSSH